MIVQCLRALLDVNEPDYAWIVQADGKLIEATLRAKKIDIQTSFRFWLKHNIRKPLISSRPEKLTFKSAAGLEEGLSGVFSASEIQFFSQTFYLIKPLSSDSKYESGSFQTSGHAAEGLSFWKWEPSTGNFDLSGPLKAKLHAEGFVFSTYEDFLNILSAESLQRFIPAIEDALNFGKDFEIEIYLDHPRQGKWIKMNGNTSQNSDVLLISGNMLDLSLAREEEKSKKQLDLWLNSGLSLFEVKDSEGRVLATWGNGIVGPQVQIESNRRVTRLMDFRNKPKFTITAELGRAEQSAEIKPEFSSPSATPSLAVEQIASLNEYAAPKSLHALSDEERCVAVTQWLGQSLDAQVSALGLFDGSRFEWKAWWKSPNRYAIPVKKYTGEWLPELDWLLDVEQKDTRDLNSIWWPQDLLPFEIGKMHGEGWMLLAEPLGNNLTSLFAIQTADPQSVKEKTKHVLKGLELLKTESQPSGHVAESHEKQLEEEIRKRDLLLKEVNHRAKNNLTLAASLVKMEAGLSANEEAKSILKQTQHRLETLAGLHELMYKRPDSQESVDASVYLNALLEGLIKGFGREGLKAEIHIEQVFLPVKMANTLGLLVNELVSNAFKHAFSDKKADHLKVDFLKKGNVFKLRVSDNGPGMAAIAPDSDSLGRILIDEFVKQLNGDIEINSGNGTTYLISFPKSSD